MFRSISVTIALFMLALPSLCATAPIECRVVDINTGEPLAFANVTIEGTGHGSVTNIEGIFVLDISSLLPEQSVLISYIGYKTKRIAIADLSKMTEVGLEQMALNLSAVDVATKHLTAEEIMELVEEHVEDNYPAFEGKQRIFYHFMNRTPAPEKDDINVKRSNFPGFDKNLLPEIMALLPEEFVEYQDAVVDLHISDGKRKLVPVHAISLEDGQQENFEKQAEEKLAVFTKDIDESIDQEGIYYKIRTGIISQKLNSEDDEIEVADSVQVDSTHMLRLTEWVNGDISRLIRDYSHYESDAWEFVTKHKHYRYNIERVTVLDSQVVYQISFEPKRKGVYQGTAYVSVADFAILMVDYEYAMGKEEENFQLLGFGHAIRARKARVMFEKLDKGYTLKYINAHKREFIAIDRTFSIMKKQKRFLFDKELAEIKFDTELQFDSFDYYELLVINREKEDSEAFEAIEEPKYVRFKREKRYEAGYLNDNTVIAPSESLKAFRRE